MAAGGWAPIDPPGPNDDRQDDQRSGGAPPPPPPPPLPRPPSGPPVATGRFTLGWQAPPAPTPGPHRVGRGHGNGPVLTVLILVAVVLAGTFTVLLTGDEDPTPAPGEQAASGTEPEAEADDTGQPATTVGNASQAFAKALRQLEEGGSFRYSGVAHAAEATFLRPTTVFPQPVAVEGEVELPRRVHELASDGSDTIHESVIVGPGFWERTNPVDAGPAAAPPYGEGRRGALDMGATLLPTWLHTTSDRTVVDAAEARALGADDDLRLFGGTLALAEVTGPLEIFIALAPDDELTHVWIGSEEAPFFVDWEISGIGDPLDVPAPGPLPDAWVLVTPADLAAAGIERPVHLTEVPEGWVLAEAWIEPDTPSGGCSTLRLTYQPVDAGKHPNAGADVAVELDVMANACVPSGEFPGDPLTVGAWSGSVWVRDGWCDGSLSDGTTTVRFLADLPLEQVEVLLGSLTPFDPEVQPTEVEGLG